MMPKRDYDRTVARIAGNLLSGMTCDNDETDQRAAVWAVKVARLIVAETRRTEEATVSKSQEAE